MSHVSDTMRNGPAYYAAAAQSDGGELGFALPKVAVKEFGAITTLDADGITAAASATAPAAGGVNLSATGVLVSGGVATFDVPRNVTILATGNAATTTFRITGTDQYGQAQTETITATTSTAVAGVKAFKTVTAVTLTSTSSVAGGVTTGTGDVFGLPHHIADKGKILAFTVDGVAAPAPTIVAGFTATGTSTATTADVRGTITATTASNGTIRFSVMYVVNPTSKETLYGAAPA